MRHELPVLLLVAILPLAGAATEGASVVWSEERDRAAPALAPELLMLARIGGAGDQALTEVQIKGTRIGFGDRRLNLRVDVAADGTCTAVPGGASDAVVACPMALPHVGSASLAGGVTYGYRQVAGNLQQPWMEGPGWALWGWGAKICNEHALMADSGIRLALRMPNGGIWCVGVCDGGNTTLHRDPRDLARRLSFPVSHGGGAGSSSFVYEVSAAGEPVRQLVLRGFANRAAWDPWGRMIVVGRGIIRGPTGPWGYPDGAGMIVVDRAWTQTLFASSFGCSGTKAENDLTWWNVAVDPASGLAALCGYVVGPIREVQPIQKAPGGGKDALVAVIRLWKPPAPATSASPGAGPGGAR